MVLILTVRNCDHARMPPQVDALSEAMYDLAHTGAQRVALLCRAPAALACWALELLEEQATSVRTVPPLPSSNPIPLSFSAAALRALSSAQRHNFEAPKTWLCWHLCSKLA